MAPDDDLPPDYEPPDFSVDPLEEPPTGEVVHWFDKPPSAPTVAALSTAFALGALATAIGFALAWRLRDDD